MLNKLTGKQWLMLLVVLIIVAAVVAVPMLGRGGEEPSPAYLTQPTMTRSVDSDTAEPTDPTDTFTVADTEVYCSVILADAPPETSVKARWVYLGEAGAGAGNEILDETEAKFEGTMYLSFKLTNDAWQVGYYEVMLFLNGVEQFSVPFTVEPG
jgi:hypothetical protein